MLMSPVTVLPQAQTALPQQWSVYWALLARLDRTVITGPSDTEWGHVTRLTQEQQVEVTGETRTF